MNIKSLLVMIILFVGFEQVKADVSCNVLRVPPIKAEVLKKEIAKEGNYFDVAKAAQWFFDYAKKHCAERIELLPIKEQTPLSFFERTLRQNAIWIVDETIPDTMSGTDKLIEWSTQRGFVLGLPRTPVFISKDGNSVNLLNENQSLRSRLKSLERKLAFSEKRTKDALQEVALALSKMQTLAESKADSSAVKELKSEISKNDKEYVEKITLLATKYKEIKNDTETLSVNFSNLKQKINKERILFLICLGALVFLSLLKDFLSSNKRNKKTSLTKKPKVKQRYVSLETLEEKKSKANGNTLLREFSDGRMIYLNNYYSLDKETLNKVLDLSEGRFLLPLKDCIVEVIKNPTKKDTVKVQGVRRSKNGFSPIQCSLTGFVRVIKRALNDNRVVGLFSPI